MTKRGPKDLEPVAATPWGPGQIDDERRTAKTRDPAREQGVRRARECVRTNRLGEPRRLAVDDASRRLGRHVARGEAGPTRREDERDAGVAERP